MKSGAQQIADERERQRVSGFDSFDHARTRGALATAAGDIIAGGDRAERRRRNGWLRGKKRDRVEELVVAGALIAAEIDRLQRRRR